MIKTIIHKNASVSYKIEGTGKPVVLVHGFAEDSNVFKHQVASLKDKYQFILPDLPGTGLSQIATNTEGWNKVETYSETIKKILEAEGIEYCSIFGHSMGGYITLGFVDLFPESVVSFGLFHSTAFEDDEQRKAKRKKGIDWMEANGASSFLKKIIPDLFSKKFQESFPEVVQSHITSSTLFSTEVCTLYYEMMLRRPDRTYVLKNASVPVLFFVGNEDKVVTLEDLLAQVQLPNQTYFYLLAGVAHMGMWEDIINFNEFFKIFLDDTTN